MRSFFSMKAVRLLLGVTVSIWMAGGCLFGCGGSAMGAGLEPDNSEPAVVAGESCHTARPHDCCASPKPKKNVASNSTQPQGVPYFAPTPRGMTKDCPLVVTATAATSRNSDNLPDPWRGPVSDLSLIENQTEFSNTSLVVSFLPNRGPTHLRCCVLLI